MLRDLLYIERNGRNPMHERNIRARTEQIAARLKSKLVSESDVTIMIKHVLGLTNIRYQRLYYLEKVASIEFDALFQNDVANAC